MLPAACFLLSLLPPPGVPKGYLEHVPPSVVLAAYVEPARFLKAAADAGLPAGDLAKLVKDRLIIDPATVRDALLMIDVVPSDKLLPVLPGALYRGAAKAPSLETLMGGERLAEDVAGGRQFLRSGLYKLDGEPVAGARLAEGVTAVAPLPTLKAVLAGPGRAEPPLAGRLKAADTGHDLTLVAAARPLREIVPKDLLDDHPDAPLYDPAVTAAVTLDFHAPVVLRAEFLAKDADAAKGVLKALKRIHDLYARDLESGELQGALDAAPEALRKPLTALAVEAIRRGTFAQNGAAVTFTVPRPKDFGPQRQATK